MISTTNDPSTISILLLAILTVSTVAIGRSWMPTWKTGLGSAFGDPFGSKVYCG